MNGEIHHYDYGDKEDRFDKLVDQGFSPDHARRMLGIKAISADEVAESSFMTPADHKPSSPKTAAGVQYGDNMRIETVDGQPIEDGTRPTDEERQRTHYYTQNWRDVAQRAIDNGTHQTPED